MADAKKDGVGYNYRFKVDIDKISMKFIKVSGLEVSLEFETFQEGGVNDHPCEFFKEIKPGVLVLEMGIGDVKAINAWFNQIVEGVFTMKSGTIILLDRQQKEFRKWEFTEAFPYKWSGPELDAKGNDIAIQKLELKYRKIKEVASN